MQGYQKNHAVERDGTVTTDFDPWAQAILERMSRVAYVLDAHRVAVARHSRELARLQAELEALEARQ